MWSALIWFWRFLAYSFMGYLLERLFAGVTRAEKQVRKCFLLLPLCPVYGLGMTVFLAMTAVEDYGFLALALRGGVITTIVEFAVHFFYEAALGVRFWDYEGVPGNVWGRVCLPFSIAWGLLSAFAAAAVDPLLEPVLTALPKGLGFAVLLLLTMDAVLSAALLRRWHDTELLTLRAVGERLEEL